MICSFCLFSLSCIQWQNRFSLCPWSWVKFLWKWHCFFGILLNIKLTGKGLPRCSLIPLTSFCVPSWSHFFFSFHSMCSPVLLPFSVGIVGFEPLLFSSSSFLIKCSLSTCAKVSLTTLSAWRVSWHQLSPSWVCILGPNTHSHSWPLFVIVGIYLHSWQPVQSNMP